MVLAAVWMIGVSILSCGRVVSFRCHVKDQYGGAHVLMKCVEEGTRPELEAGHYNLHAWHVCCLVTMENWPLIPLSTFQ
jgi:hypothetical protein